MTQVKKQMMRYFALLICVVAILMSCCSGLKVSAAEPEDVIYIDHTFWSMGEKYQWSFPYSDNWFLNSDSEYNHQMAQGTMGLMVSGFPRSDLKKPNKEVLKDYYDKIGFTDAEYFSYDEEPQEYTIANGIASKKIGNATVLAVCVRGEGYGDEWVSNLTLGSGKRHEGFEMAAEMVEERLQKYIERHEISGEMKLWITGFSRSSAVANMVAADCTDSGKFSGVYAYCFAVPANNCEEKEYSNIFNILGKYDPVPKVPSSDWGWHRYGTDIYTPAQRTDSDYADKLEAANIVYRKLTGRELYSTPVLNNMTESLLVYLYELIRSQEDYVSLMQPAAISAWRLKGGTQTPKELLTLLTKTVDNIISENKEKEEEFRGMRDYLLNLVAVFSSGKQDEVFGEEWDDALGTKNLFREHLPIIYLSWLFSSDDPDKIFSNQTMTTIVSVSGAVQVEIYNEDGFSSVIDTDGSISDEVPENVLKRFEGVVTSYKPYYQVRNGVFQISIPRDKAYLLRIIPNKKNQMSIASLNADCTRSEVTVSKAVKRELRPDRSYFIYVPPIGAEQENLSIAEADGNEYVLDTMMENEIVPFSSVAYLSRINFFNLNFNQLRVVFLVSLSAIGIIMLLWIINIIRRIATHQKSSLVIVFAQHAIGVALFTMLEEITTVYLGAIPILSIIFGLGALVCIAGLCIRIIRGEDGKISSFVIVALILFVISNGLIRNSKGVFATYTTIAACICITVGLVRIKRPGIKELFWWLGISIVLCGMCIAHRLYNPLVPLSVNLRLQVIILVVTGMNVCATFQKKTVRLTILMLVVPNILSLFEYHLGRNAGLHLAVIAVWNIILLSVCAICLIQNRKKEEVLI